MTARFEYGYLSNSKESKQLNKILNQCFFVPSEDFSDIYLKRLGQENYRVIRCDKQLIGGLATIPMGQWWGRQRVPMTGISAMAITPEYRGAGAATIIMQQVLRELYELKVPISVLYSSAQQLYRLVDYEQSGLFCRWQIPTSSIQLQERTLYVQPITEDAEICYQLYQQQAQQYNGHLDRHRLLWQMRLPFNSQEKAYAYLLGSTEQPEGYILFSKKRIGDKQILQVKDWVLLTTAAIKNFWSFLAAHRSQIDTIQWQGSPIDALILSLPEQSAQLKMTQRWMLRIVDVQQALEQRGYPSSNQTELHFEVQDDLLPENRGRFILSVANGKGQISRGGKGELKVTIRGLAPLYTGLLTAHQLQLAGLLTGPENTLSLTTQLFTGSLPWMPDII